LSLTFLFDLDGVIVDSMPLHLAVWEEYLAQHGLDPAEFAQRMHGSRNDALVRALFGDHLDDDDVFRHGAAKEALWRQRMEPRLAESIVPGVQAFLARHVDVPKAIGTNAEPANVDFVLHHGGLRSHFPVVVDGSQVRNPKPHPEIYLRAAHLLGARPADCIVFEDSPTGAAAGRAAGMRVVGINTARLVRLEGVSLLIDDFDAPELDAWLAGQRSGSG